MFKRATFYVSGYVQGVFYRASARQVALKLGLKGFCRNLSDGRVEVVVEGEEGQIEEMFAWCQKGPSGAHVSHVEIKWVEPTSEFTHFDVR